eukprot:Nitzschia sp. Nitz4//scaffold40_size135432//103825//106064//NITZ4_003261-RA/size135432-snap-gene-0.118-mRNA-1//1//CDS//3329551270//1571//frame0
MIVTNPGLQGVSRSAATASRRIQSLPHNKGVRTPPHAPRSYRSYTTGTNGSRDGYNSSHGGGSRDGRNWFSFLRRERAFATSAPNRDSGLANTAVVSDPDEVPGPEGLPSRAAQLRLLENSLTDDEFDILVVGGGATGAGIALDAATRGLKVACIERGDFSSETSSRSTKLIWAGIKYMGTATAILLSPQLLMHPIATVKNFVGEMTLVLNSHRERKYMTEQQAHLCNWVPLVIPIDRWHVSPPPFGHWLYGFFPVLAPFVLKFYDALSYFQCPPSYVLTPHKTRMVFPQLDDTAIKYCAVFYEAQHNDARTNLAIAMSAAEHGATIANYVEMTRIQKDSNTGKAVGVEALDRMTGKRINVRAKKVVFAGGPFTDDMRRLEDLDHASEGSDKESVSEFTAAVRGAHGTHIVLPGYFCNHEMGVLDFNTSDGRFLFILPWENHTLVGTTDSKSQAETSPTPPEDEIDWLLNEASKYFKKDLEFRRNDVLSSWRGWRPLAVDPHAPPGTPPSRDHVISENKSTGIIFVAGGKWTTWREMAEDVTDRIVGDKGPHCKTMEVKLFGGAGFESTLSVQLIQKYGMPQSVAEHLAKTYGTRAWELCSLMESRGIEVGKDILLEGYPYLEADVIWACREYACTIEDVLSRRTRLAFINKDAALRALPRVAEIMAKELGWSKKVTCQQMAAAKKYVDSYGGPVPLKE